MDKNTALLLSGFLLFMYGLLALILSLIGIKLAFLTWIDAPGALFGFIVRLIMIFGGVVLAILSRTNWEEE